MAHGKKYRAVVEKLDKERNYSVEEALKFVRENKIAKFDESVEVHIKTGIDPKKTDQQIRSAVSLPHGTGKNKRIAVITSTSLEDAKKAGAEIVGGEELIERIKNEKIFSKDGGFDVLIATPEMMPKLAVVAKILGPKGLMPNPKTETVTTKIKETVDALKKGRAVYKTDNSGNIHQVVGKLSFTDEKLLENIKAFLDSVEKVKPASVKGKLVKAISLCSTMGVGFRITS